MKSIEQSIINAKKLIAEGRQDEAINLLTPMAKSGNEESQYIVGEAYLFGEGVNKNFSLAFKWLTLAYKNNNAKAAIRLATIYDPDYIFSDLAMNLESNKIKDKKISKQIYNFGFNKLLKLAKLKNKEAMTWVAMCYETGWGVKEDINIANLWYKEATRKTEP